MLHPIWPTTCYCRGEIKTKELEEAKRAASTPRRFKFKSTRVAASVNKDSEAAPTPKSFKFSSGKRPHEEESESATGGKKGKVGRGGTAAGRGGSAGQGAAGGRGVAAGRGGAAGQGSAAGRGQGSRRVIAAEDSISGWFSREKDKAGLAQNNSKARTGQAIDGIDGFKFVSRKYTFKATNDSASAQKGKSAKTSANEGEAKTTTENLEARVKELEAKVKAKKEKAEKEKQEAKQNQLKERYKQLQETFKRLKKEEKELKLQKNIKKLAEKCKSLEEKLQDEKSQIYEGEGDEEKEKKSKRGRKKGGEAKNRNKG